jgi:hypothetical protein
MMTDEEFEREAAWRALAESLFMRLSECQRLTVGTVTAMPKLPTQDELDSFATRFRALSAAGGWTSGRPSRAPRRPWWLFWRRA